jgi:hypothetical protein
VCFAAGLLALCATAPSVYAQSETPAPRGVSLGSLRLTPRVVVQDLGVDSNVFNSPTRRQSDFTFVVVPQVEGIAGARVATVSFRSSTDFVYFAQHASERSVNQDLAAMGQLRLRRVSLTTSGNFLNTRRRPNEEIDSRARRTEIGGDINARLAVAPKLGVEAGTRLAQTKFDPDATFGDIRLAEVLNRTSRVYYAGTRYTLTPITELVANVERGHDRFSRSPIRDTDSTGVYGGINFNPRALISGGLSVGYQRFRPISGAFAPFSGVVGSADVAYRIRQSTQIGVMLHRKPAYSYEPAEPYYIWDGVGGSLRRQLVATLDLELRVRRYWYRYREIVSPAQLPLPPARTDTWNSASAALNYQMGRTTRMTFGVDYWVRKSDLRLYRDYDGLRIGTSIRYGF